MEFSDQLIIYLYSYFPAIMLGLFFWWLDRFERESLFLVVFVFLWGAFGAGLLSYFWNTFFHIWLEIYQEGSTAANNILVTVMVAPFVEELTKGFIIVILLKMNEVDNVTDGILLGIIIGLGFAAAENVHYAKAVVYPSSGELAMWYNLWFREIHTTLLHASATAVWGAMIGYSRHLKPVQKFMAIFIGFILAMMTHGCWNFLASYVNTVRADFNVVEIIMRLELVVIFGLLLILFLMSLFHQSQCILKQLKEEGEQEVIPESHIGFFASLVRLNKKYKLPPKIKAKDYAKIGVRLAFRKTEYQENPTKELKLEIDALRGKLKELTRESLEEKSQELEQEQKQKQ